MGWFDGDSSSDEEQKTKSKKKDQLKHDVSALFDTQPPQPLSTNGGSRDQEDGADDVEEDPLDAYMKSLGNPTGARSSSSNNLESKASRLDEENEDEATSHWMTKKADIQEGSSLGGTTTNSSNNVNSGDDDNYNNDYNNNRGYSQHSTMARQALESTFHKANQKGNNHNDEDEKKNTNVDITLKPVQHDQINYSKINKQIVLCQNTSKGHLWRQKQSVTCHPPMDPIPQDMFTSAHAATSLQTTSGNTLLPESLKRWCRQEGYTNMTPVQCQTMSIALNGSNGLITASTGSGKTLAFLWPLVLHLFHNDTFHRTNPANNRNYLDREDAVDGSNSKGLILVPTRELALQVEKVAYGLGKAVLDLSANQRPSLAITGGSSSSTSMDNKSTSGRYQLSQTLYKSDPRILIATPGRLLDVLRALPKKQQNTFSFMSRVTFCVLDEADKLLQMGFANQVTQLLQQLRPDRQCLMTSATMSRRMEQVANQWLETSTVSPLSSASNDKKKNKFNPTSAISNKHHNLVRISVGTTGRASDHVDQHVIVLPNQSAKEQFIVELLPSLVAVGRTLIFVATREGCEQLANRIRDQQQRSIHSATTVVQIETLHGDKHQTDRNAALKAFSKGRVPVLIATDVAGRGLDIPNVATVLNYDPAKNLDTHVHRVGRAGRLNKDANVGEASVEGSNVEGTKAHNKGTAYTLLLPKQADFARVLKSAYEREGRPVSDDLAKLAATSWRGWNVGAGGGGRHGQNKQRLGLGFSGSSHSSANTIAENHTMGTTNPASSSVPVSYYGPAGSTSDAPTAPPPRKKSRWG